MMRAKSEKEARNRTVPNERVSLIDLSSVKIRLLTVGMTKQIGLF